MDKEERQRPLLHIHPRNRKKAVGMIMAMTQNTTIGALAIEMQLQKKQRRPRRAWVWPYLHRRLEYCHYDTLMQELYLENPELYRNYTRMDRTLFNDIVERVTPHIEKKTTFWRTPIDPALRVAITLRFLATGNSYKSLRFSFRVAHNTISNIVPETCNAIANVYGPEVIKVPRTANEWKEVTQGFYDKWNFPHVLGSIDGKHIRPFVVEDMVLKVWVTKVNGV